MNAPVILLALRQPEQLETLDLAGWDLLLRQAAATNLTATLLGILEQRDLLALIPAPAREHFEWARTLAARHGQAVRFEVARIGEALAGLGLPLILLKGAAYVIAGLPPARGRLFSDIDILVPKERLGEVEAALMLHGWAGNHHDDYDQRYYRQWMHELPPMQHTRRQSLIDVHHAILPETATARPDPARLRAAAVTLEGQEGVKVLAPADMVLHSAVHLFSDGEFNNALRDLVDIDRLLRHFAGVPGFWVELPRRAVELELTRPLFYALRYARKLLGAPIPVETMTAAEAGRPNPVLLVLMDQLFDRALLPDHPSCSDWLSKAASSVLYIRGNWLRMPPLLLTRHLLHKALLSPKED